MGKKGQVTVFIIIGLAALIIAGIVFFSANAPKINEISSSADINVKEIEPVKSYMEKTIQQLVIEGLFVIGKQGGVIYFSTWPDCKEESPSYNEQNMMCDQNGSIDYNYPPYLSSSPYLFKRMKVGINSSIDERKTQADRTDVLFPLEQPYAYLHQGEYVAKNYLYGWNEPLPTITDPDTYSMEGELTNWTKNHLREMLNFTDFEKTGYDIKLEGDPTAKVSINDNDITVNVNYTLHITKSGSQYTLTEYYTRIPYNFRRMYNFVNYVIERDVVSLDEIWKPKMYDENGKLISLIQRTESIPPDYKYDIINITDMSVDFHTMYNSPDQYFSFLFVRETRPPDAGTVYAIPDEAVYMQVPQTWYCPNFETAGVFMDPNEDDKFHADPFPFTNPPWYQWKSRGDNLEMAPQYTCNGIERCPAVSKIAYHNELSNDKYGLHFTDALAACGNEQLDVGPFMGTADDVGDELILTVGNQMAYPAGQSVVAPEWYKESPIVESGTGRLNDINTFRPIKCEGSPKCSGGYWRFNERTTTNTVSPESYCVETCTQTKYTPASGSRANHDYKPPSCDHTCQCYQSTKVYVHVNQAGELISYPDTDPSLLNPPTPCPPSTTGPDCPAVPNEKLGCSDPRTPPAPESPGTDSKFKPVCCASPDGKCQDIGVPRAETGCGNTYPTWTLLSDKDFCNQLPDCETGCCTIRGKAQNTPMQKFECISTCKDAKSCTCTGSDLSSCTGDYSWKAGSC